MENEFQKSISSLKKKSIFDETIEARPTAKVDPSVLRDLTRQLERLANKFNVSVDELLEIAEHSPEFKEEYLEARKISCQIALLKK